MVQQGKEIIPSKTELDLQTKELQEIEGDQIAPKNLNRTTLEYKLARHWYRQEQKMEQLLQKEIADHQITKQELIRADGILEEYANAYNAQDRIGLNAKKIADQNIAADYAAATEMDNVFQPKKMFNFKFGMWAAIAVIALAFIWQYGGNANFKAGVDKNMPALVIIAIVGIVIAVYLTMRKGKK